MATDKPYPNAKVAALIDGHTSIDSTWTAVDFADLAMAAADQADVGRNGMRRILEVMPLADTAWDRELVAGEVRR